MTILEAIEACHDRGGWMRRPVFSDWIRPNWDINWFVFKANGTKATEQVDLRDLTADDWQWSWDGLDPT